MAKITNQQIIENGRTELRRMLERAIANGEIYYAIVSVSRSGMSRTIQLAYIGENHAGKPELLNVWPKISDEMADGVGDYNRALEIVAKDWGFSFKKRAFVVGGCGMDMVFALVNSLCASAFSGKEACKLSNSIRRVSMINT